MRTIDISALIDGRRLSAFNYRLIILSWLITVFDGFDMMVIGFTAPYMRDEFGLSKLMLGRVFSSGLVGMMIGGFCFSYLGDRIGRRPTIVIAALGFGALTTATAFANSYHALLTLRFLDGLALGGMLPLAWALNIEFVPRRMRSSVVTIIMMGYSLGTAIAAPMTNALGPQYGWQAVYLAGGLGTLVCALALWIALPESLRLLVTRQMDPGRIVAILRRLDPKLEVTPADRFVLSDEPPAEANFQVAQLFRGDLRLITPLLWVGYVASSFAIYFSASWGPSVLEELNFARSTSALVSSAGGLLGAVAGLLLMRFTDRIGAIAVAFYPILAVVILVVQGYDLVPHTWFLATVVLGGLLLGGAHFGILSIAGIYYPSAIRASGAGWATSVAKIGGILGPVVGAAVLASGLPILRSYALLAVCPAILFLCALGIHRVVRARSLQPQCEARG